MQNSSPEIGAGRGEKRFEIVAHPFSHGIACVSIGSFAGNVACHPYS
jgi:hypothetical protein